MKLYFLRHADARPGADDANRPLSPCGRSEAERMGRFLCRAGVALSAAYASPLLRAVETAEFVLRAFPAGRRPRLRKTPALLNEATRGEFKRWLRALPKQANVLLVGHAPSLSERVARLLRMKDATLVDLPKGALACLETDDGRRGRLRLFLSPRDLIVPPPVP